MSNTAGMDGAAFEVLTQHSSNYFGELIMCMCGKTFITDGIEQTQEEAWADHVAQLMRDALVSGKGPAFRAGSQR